MTTRHALTLSEKVELIRDSEENISYRVLAEKYKVSVGSVSNIIKRKAEYIESFEQNDSSTKKRSLRNEYSEQVDRLVYEWFVLQRSKNIPVTGPLLQEQARQIRQQLGGPGVDDFKASNGWLEKFRSRHSIKSRILCGEAASVDCATVDEWKKRLPSIIDKYDPNDIYNADESGLFFKALPTRSLVLSKEACKGGKRSKERFTILLCTNMTGKHKLQPLLIGKAANPRCFKHLNIKQLPVTWRSNRSSWMTANLFDEWLISVNKTMVKEKRNILLFIDHAPCHNADLEYSNVIVKFFPPNTTSKLQPLDQGIIKNFKCFYRQQLVKHVINRCAVSNTADDIIITALDAVYWAANAWKAVTESTITRTFRTAGFIHSNDQQFASATIHVDDVPTETVSDDTSVALRDLDALLGHITIGGEKLLADQFVEIDSDIATFNEADGVDENLLIVNGAGDRKDKLNGSDDEDETSSEAPPKLIEAMDMVRRLHILAATEQPQLHHLISQLDSQLNQLFLDSQRVKQSKIDDYFHATE